MSVHFRALTSGVRELRNRLLPKVFIATGNYRFGDSVEIKARSFVVLAHAEMETYLEERVIEIATTALQSWNSQAWVCRTTLCLLGFSGKELERPPSSLAPPKPNLTKKWPARLDISSRLEDAVKQYVDSISTRNHGVREPNILKMLLPIGYHHSKCDPLLLTELNNFGSVRGQLAHHRRARAVQQVIDPETEFRRIDGLLKLLAPVDRELNVLLKEASP